MFKFFGGGNIVRQGVFESVNPVVFGSDFSFSSKRVFSVLDYKGEVVDILSRFDKREVFRLYEGVSSQNSKLLFDAMGVKSYVFEILCGNFGREFFRSQSFKVEMPSSGVAGFFEVMSGEGVALVESGKNGEEVSVIHFSKGDKFFVNSGDSFVIWNSNLKENLVLFSIFSSFAHFERGAFLESFGPSIFVTDSGFLRNKNVSPFYVLRDFSGSVVGDFRFDASLYDEFLKLPEKFHFLGMIQRV